MINNLKLETFKTKKKRYKPLFSIQDICFHKGNLFVGF